MQVFDRFLNAMVPDIAGHSLATENIHYTAVFP